MWHRIRLLEHADRLTPADTGCFIHECPCTGRLNMYNSESGIGRLHTGNTLKVYNASPRPHIGGEGYIRGNQLLSGTTEQTKSE